MERDSKIRGVIIMKNDEKAKQCYYYGCAGTMICTYYPWTTNCTYPKCNKKDLSTNKSAYEAAIKDCLTNLI